MKLMFEMMNAARIEVGLQGMAVGAASQQAAVDFAKERIQGRHWSEASNREAPKVSIIEHPDVRRMLVASGAYVEGIRALLLQTAFYIDKAGTSEGRERETHQHLVELLTPVCKAWGSDWGFRVTEWCLQVYGGYGYTKDYPAEQYLRDAKIASIYEGTNGIQALDLVGRKLRIDDGRPFAEILGRCRDAAATAESITALEGVGDQLNKAVELVEGVAKSMPKHPDGLLLSLQNAVPFLDMFGHVLAGCFLIEQSAIAHSKLSAIAAAKGVDLPSAGHELVDGDSEARYYHNKIQTTVFFGLRCLPKVGALGSALEAGEISSQRFVF